MLDFITEFISNNTQMVIVAVIALVVMVGMYMFKPQMFKKPEEQPFQVPGMDMDMNMNMDMQTQMEMPIDNGMCNMDTGICQSHQEMEQQMTPEMQQQMIQEQQQMTPEMQQQMMQEQQQMTPEMQQQMTQDQHQMTTEM